MSGLAKREAVHPQTLVQPDEAHAERAAELVLAAPKLGVKRFEGQGSAWHLMPGAEFTLVGGQVNHARRRAGSPGRRPSLPQGLARIAEGRGLQESLSSPSGQNSESAGVLRQTNMTGQIRQALTLLSTAAIATLLTAVATNWILKEKRAPLVHKLTQPLLLSGAGSANANYLLPQGTSLYYDQAFPEGFVRYKIYINVEGIKLESREATEKFWLNPLSAFPVDKENLAKLLRQYPLTKDDLIAILKSGSISKDEIRDLLREYSQ